jgi:hypothetical protein
MIDPSIDTPCPPTCVAHGSPLTREHSPGCPWRRAASFALPDRANEAVERARAERAKLGPGSNGHG